MKLEILRNYTSLLHLLNATFGGMGRFVLPDEAVEMHSKEGDCLALQWYSPTSTKVECFIYEDRLEWYFTKVTKKRINAPEILILPGAYLVSNIILHLTEIFE